jgi:hypothetical protein
MLDRDNSVDSLACSEGKIINKATSSTSLKITIKTDYVCFAAHLMAETLFMKLRCGNVTPLPRLRLRRPFACFFGIYRMPIVHANAHAASMEMISKLLGVRRESHT